LYSNQDTKVLLAILALILSIASDTGAAKVWSRRPFLSHSASVVIPDHLEEKGRILPPFVAAMRFEDTVEKAVWSDDGKKLLITTWQSGTTYVIDVMKKSVNPILSGLHVRGAAWGPDARMIALNQETPTGSIKIFSSSSLQEIAQIDHSILGECTPGDHLSFGPAGKTLWVSCSPGPKNSGMTPAAVRLNTETGKPEIALAIGHPANGKAASVVQSAVRLIRRDGRHIYLGVIASYGARPIDNRRSTEKFHLVGYDLDTSSPLFEPQEVGSDERSGIFRNPTSISINTKLDLVAVNMAAASTFPGVKQNEAFDYSLALVDLVQKKTVATFGRNNGLSKNVSAEFVGQSNTLLAESRADKGTDIVFLDALTGDKFGTDHLTTAPVLTAVSGNNVALIEGRTVNIYSFVE